jgi:hypothetical protein
MDGCRRRDCSRGGSGRDDARPSRRAPGSRRRGRSPGRLARPRPGSRADGASQPAHATSPAQGRRARVRPRRRPTALIVYFDTSALVKLIFDEPGSELAVEPGIAPTSSSRASSSTPRHAQRSTRLLAGAVSANRRTSARSPRSRISTPNCAPSRSTNHWPATPVTSPPNTLCAATTPSTSLAPCSARRPERIRTSDHRFRRPRL